MSKHTPAPWRVEKHRVWGWCIRGGTRRNVGTGAEEEGFVAAYINTQADAQIMGASRELLEALEAFVEVVDYHEHMTTISPFSLAVSYVLPPKITAAADTARAVIAKARGDA